MRSGVLGLVCCVLCALAPPARADGLADEADLQFTVGAEAYGKGEFTLALEHFLASNRLVANRNVMFNIARAYEQLGRYPDAYRYYLDATRGDAVDVRLQRDVTAALARIGPRVAVLAIETSPPGATIYLDRRDLGSVGTAPAHLGLKAGSYTVIAELPGFEPATLTGVAITVGESRPLRLELARILGQVDLNGEPGTRVRIDDEHGAVAGVLPCTLALPPGPHLAYFERPGFTIAPQSFTIIEKQTVRASASGVAVVGSLLVAADEPNALIEVDGAPLGFTPAVLPNVPVGHRRVRVSLHGYQPVERTVEVRVNAQTDLRDLVLVPERSVSAASRETESIEDAPASVTVISAQELEAFAYPTILEALRGVRGYAVNFDSVYGNASVRGLGQANDFSNRLLVLSDGAVLNENILYQPFIHYDGRTDLGDVQRIEIVRGPSSVLYGTGAVSGVVNLVLKDRDEPDGVHAQLSSYDNSTARVRAGFAERLGRDAGVWASVAGASSQGRAVALPIADGGSVDGHTTQDFDKFHSYTVTGKAWFKDLTLQSFWTAREDTIPTGNYGARFGDTRSYGDDQRFLTELKLDHKFGDRASFMARAHVDYAYYHSDYWYDADPAMPQPGTADTYNYYETYKSWWGGGEARGTLELGGGLRLTVGGEAVLNERANMEGGAYNVGGTMLTPDLHTNTPYQVFAGSAVLDWRPWRALRVQAGVRLDHWNLEGNQLAAPGEDRGATGFSATSPRVAVIVKPSERDVVKLMAGSAFRAPSAYEVYYTDGGSTQVPSYSCGDKLAPEKIYSAELETTHKFTPDWVGLASVYGTLAQNIIESVPVDDACAAQHGIAPGLLYYRNSPVGQQFLGADLELRRELRGGILASFQYGYNHGRYASGSTDDPSLPSSTRLPNAPAQYAGFKVMFPIVTSAVTGALRGALEDRRRIDTTTTDQTERAVVVDAVISGAIGRYGVRYAAGVYNLFNWQYALPAVPYAANLMPQGGRSFIFSLTATR
ncbi:MAG TPA: TonB-dependent receptor [Kofleriaceae bacterium]|jgi:outer membrane receptor protein involved in Fe transport|nr:TonB-dependent receptor [Kofleriaceae bacterium]